MVWLEENFLKMFANVKFSAEESKRNATIDDVTITVKTSKKFHEPRVGLLLKTWMKRVLKQVGARWQ